VDLSNNHIEPAAKRRQGQRGGRETKGGEPASVAAQEENRRDPRNARAIRARLGKESDAWHGVGANYWGVRGGGGGGGGEGGRGGWGLWE